MTFLQYVTDSNLNHHSFQHCSLFVICLSVCFKAVCHSVMQAGLELTPVAELAQDSLLFFCLNLSNAGTTGVCHHTPAKICLQPSKIIQGKAFICIAFLWCPNGIIFQVGFQVEVILDFIKTNIKYLRNIWNINCNLLPIFYTRYMILSLQSYIMEEFYFTLSKQILSL